MALGKRQSARFVPAIAVAVILWCVSLQHLQAQAPGSVALAPSYTPLTGSERWRRYWNETFLSPGLYFASLGAASGSQLGNDPPEWKQGIAGYGCRSLSLFGSFTTQTTIHEASAAALGYEPRYIRCQCAGALRRTGHAIKWSLLTKNQEGRTRIDIPTLAGAYGSGMISMYWYPQRFSPLTDGVRTGHQKVGFVMGIHVIQEFGPELKHFFHFGK